MIRPKAAPLRLDPLSYESLRRQILHRDGWRCQSCGTMSNLEVHHQEFRSHSGTTCQDRHRGFWLGAITIRQFRDLRFVRLLLLKLGQAFA